MIICQTAGREHLPQMIRLWCSVFGDSEAYVRRFYRHWMPKAETVIAADGRNVTGMFHMLPAELHCGSTHCRCYYLYAGAVLPEYRRQGIFRQIITQILQKAAAENAALLLIPANDDLFRYYGKFGFRRTVCTAVCETETGCVSPQEKPVLEELDAETYSALRSDFLLTILQCSP